MNLELNNIEVSKKVDQPYINTVLWLIDLDDEPVVIDRKETEYTFKETDNKVFLNMVWRDIYIWDGENELDIPEKYIDEYKCLKGKLVGIEIEDDAPKEYGIISF